MSRKTQTPDAAFEFLMTCTPPSKEEMLLLGWKTNTTGQRTKVTEDMLEKKKKNNTKNKKTKKTTVNQ